MNRIGILFLAMLLSAQLCAGSMMHLLQGGYDAKVMTMAQMDSVLNIGNQESDIGKRYRLEWENEQKLFRHSFLADYYLVDTQKNSRIKLSDQPVRDAVISPNGKYVVYAKADNNLYIYKVADRYLSPAAEVYQTEKDSLLPAP